MTEKHQHRVAIKSDESGFIKMVEFNGKALPVMSFEIEASGGEPIAKANLTMHVDVDMTAVIGQVTLVCPLCEEEFHHLCYADPPVPDEEYNQDPKY